ncbi:rod shape-determining protein MreC [Sphingomonas aracearum]|uniref:Cell shape-determining protein MreC n=1 Tax=Sphingomonas aracearum TaxID=2283317 RepID=A0A369VW79_9SPHN|nr:rod shape-determining protein MreC [Sphingomonas aracearum]RDE05430.1 rod shape-determining protein MreC [Sphingomonas aracearum]
MAPSRNRGPGFSRRAQWAIFTSYVVAGAGALVALVLLVVSIVAPSAFAVFRSAAAEVTTPVSSGVAAVGRGIAAVPESIGNHFHVMGENARLRATLQRERRVLSRARMLAYDNARLKRLLAMRDRAAAPVTSARLVSSSATSTRRFAVLNAGRWQGVCPGQPVVGPEGLVGRVTEAGPNAARVLLISDPESIVPVRRTRDGLPALAVGRGDGRLDIRVVTIGSGVLRPGDTFVTSGTGGLYRPDIPVARVLARSGDTAEARPFTTPDTLDFAIVEQAFLPIPAAPPAPK